MKVDEAILVVPLVGKNVKIFKKREETNTTIYHDFSEIEKEEE